MKKEKIRFIPCNDDDLIYHKQKQKARAGKAGKRIQHSINAKRRT